MTTTTGRALLPARTSGASSWLVRKLLDACGNPPVRVVLWNGATGQGCASPPVATVTIEDLATLLRLCLRPELAFGEGYASGRITVEGDLAGLLDAFMAPSLLVGPLQRIAARLLDRPSGNGVGGARRNVHAHYDLGNEFYKLWLDEQLLYTCAYYRSRRDSLEQAQQAKLEHVCRKLRLRPGERVLEVGCGWGALALHMAEKHAVTVRAYNVSTEQLAYARDQARRRGLEGRVEFLDGDYREATGSFDAFVSVGMLEHVGREHYQELGAVIDRTLEPDGRGLLHFVGRPRPWKLNAWTERHVFPGAHIPSLREALEVLEPRELAVLDVEDLRFHYARTLADWLDRFERCAPVVEERFGAEFVRTWRLYLASSMAGFRAGCLQLFQVLFARPARTSLPLTRAHLHVAERDRDLIGEEPERWNARTS